MIVMDPVSMTQPRIVFSVDQERSPWLSFLMDTGSLLYSLSMASLGRKILSTEWSKCCLTLDFSLLEPWHKAIKSSTKTSTYATGEECDGRQGSRAIGVVTEFEQGGGETGVEAGEGFSSVKDTGRTEGSVLAGIGPVESNAAAWDSSG